MRVRAVSLLGTRYERGQGVNSGRAEPIALEAHSRAFRTVPLLPFVACVARRLKTASSSEGRKGRNRLALRPPVAALFDVVPSLPVRGILRAVNGCAGRKGKERRT